MQRIVDSATGIQVGEPGREHEGHFRLVFLRAIVSHLPRTPGLCKTDSAFPLSTPAWHAFAWPWNSFLCAF